VGGPYPGVFIFTQNGRMVRPVLQLGTSGDLEPLPPASRAAAQALGPAAAAAAAAPRRELLGSLEQAYLNVQCPDGGFGGSPGLAFTHRELGASEAGGPWACWGARGGSRARALVGSLDGTKPLAVRREG
jgi:DNA-directed RNA polymerase I subunit RPA2